MTAPARKTTPAKATQPAAPAATEPKAAPKTSFDFASLTPVEAEAPRRTVANRAAEDLSVFEGWLRKSWDARGEGDKVGKGFALPPLPESDAKTIKNKLVTAAERLELGLSTTMDEKDGKFVLRYAAKQRKQFAKRTRTTDSEAEKK